MDIKITPADKAPDVMIVTIAGRIDSYTVEHVSEQIESLIRIGNAKLVCNLAGVEFVSGVGLKAFLKATKDARAQGGDLRICALQPAVASSFNLAGYTAVAQVYPTENDALIAFGVSAGPGAYDQTMVAGGNEYEQTMLAGDNNIPGAGQNIGFENTMLDGGGIGFEQTMLENNDDIGFQETMVDSSGSSPAPADPMQALRDKLKAASTGSGASERADGLPKMEPFVISIPAELRYVDCVSGLVGAAGELAGVKKMDMVRYGVGVVEVLKVLISAGGSIKIEIAGAAKQVTVELSGNSLAGGFYNSLRPQMDQSIQSADAAKTWLDSMVSAVDVNESSGGMVVILKKS